MGLIESFKTTWRYRYWKKQWEEGKKLSAIITVLNGLANITFPFKDAKGQRWHTSYDNHCKQCRQKWGSRGMNSMKCWKVYFWRQLLGHMIMGGLPLSVIPSLVLFFLVPFYLWQWLVPLVVGILFIIKESLHDYEEEQKRIEQAYGLGAQEAKNGVDVIFWIAGASILPLIFTLTKGLHF